MIARLGTEIFRSFKAFMTIATSTTLLWREACRLPLQLQIFTLFKKAYPRDAVHLRHCRTAQRDYELLNDPRNLIFDLEPSEE